MIGAVRGIIFNKILRPHLGHLRKHYHCHTSVTPALRKLKLVNHRSELHGEALSQKDIGTRRKRKSYCDYTTVPVLEVNRIHAIRFKQN